MGVSWLGHGSVMGWSWQRHGQGGHGLFLGWSWYGHGFALGRLWVVDLSDDSDKACSEAMPAPARPARAALLHCCRERMPLVGEVRL